MNHRSSGSLSLSKAIEGFLSFKSAEGLSDRTVDSYDCLLKKWSEHVGDRDISKITAADITGSLSWLRTDYTPHRFSGKTEPLSPKTLRNVWVTLCSFYSWASRELHIANVMKDVPAPCFKVSPQSILGYNSLDMVRRYALIADLDVENAHRKASPADNWHL